MAKLLMVGGDPEGARRGQDVSASRDGGWGCLLFLWPSGVEGLGLTARSWKKRLPLRQEIWGKGWWRLQAGGREAQALSPPPLTESARVLSLAEWPSTLFPGALCYKMDSEHTATSPRATQFRTAGRFALFRKARAVGRTDPQRRRFGIRPWVNGRQSKD